MYVERRSHLAPLIVWTRTVQIAGSARVLPDGCMDLIWSGDELIVAGPDTVAHPVENTPGTRYAAVRCAPGIGPALFGLPAHPLRDRRVPLADVWGGRDVRVLTERIAAAADPAAFLEHLAAERLREHDAAAARFAGAVVGELRAGADIATVAAEVNLSERQLHRRSLTAFGYGPKTLARVLRLDRALGLARGGVPAARVAAVAGYADQAHFARDVKALAGVPLRTLLSG
ncbi:helix-turn-helix domain-containing protein [Embleya scabrispora]|uniref:helix-turn-helix domain-containing protein n=1 Tax=Embleya scabrispora TaxID=159449 RepID=UPI0003638404|nr:helix-turn-helix domain-containing protein [Embleya scabrispora]MYS83554.1 helix-turn-helix domain-containing protein [Streptomyces sp. SID5474]